MKKLILVILSTFFIFSNVTAQEKNISCERSALLIAMLDKYHYQPIQLNDKISAQIFDDFIDALDPYSIVFTQVELNKLESFKYIIDDKNSESLCSFLKLSTSLFHERLIKVDTLIGAILNKPFDFHGKDTITFIPFSEKVTSENDAQLEKRLRKRLKYNTLEFIFSANDESEKPLLSDDKTLLLKEPEARKKLRAKEKRYIKRMLEYPMGFENYVFVKFNNALANRFDPHTLYFSTLEKENFDAGLFKEAKSFGLSFNEGKNGEVTIGSLTPGGPAWKSSELHKDDVVLKIKWPDQEPIDLSYSSPSEVNSLIHSSTSDKIELTIRQGNGMVNTVTLYRQVINVEENTITGFVLNGDKKIGYISLPGFYTEMNSARALGCANDVAKEILKLKQEDIEGLIFDLRFNGGGSLYEAVNLAGIFIDEGPLCMMRDKSSKIQLMKDMNRGTIYNGPLILMVNGFSASASEIFTAGMKDYNRALVVGSTTYGKSIGQVTLPIDTTINVSTYTGESNASDYVNITRSKFYGINGISNQYTGVSPDIKLPDFYNNLVYGEASDPYSLKGDTVTKKVIFNPLAAIPKTELESKSKSRTDLNPSFKRISTLADSLETNRKQRKKIILTLEDFRKHQVALDRTETEITRLMANPSEKFKVNSAQFDEEVLKADNYKKEMNDVLIKNIQDDLFIEESYFIMQDYINLINK